MWRYTVGKILEFVTLKTCNDVISVKNALEREFFDFVSQILAEQRDFRLFLEAFKAFKLPFNYFSIFSFYLNVRKDVMEILENWGMFKCQCLKAGIVLKSFNFGWLTISSRHRRIRANSFLIPRNWH